MSKINPISSFHSSKFHIWLKTCVILVAISFVLPYLTWAFDAGSYAISQPHFLQIKHLGKTLTIPEKIGAIHNGFQGSRKTVVSIQDLHCNYEVQKNIAGIIEHLVKKHNLKLIAQEGAFGAVDTSVISAFPIRQVREEVSDYFVKQGEITGAEHYTILSGNAVHLEGIETPELYTASQKAVRGFLNAESQGYCYDLRDRLDELKAEIYNPMLLKFDKMRLAWRQGDIDLLKYSAYLLRAVRRLDLKASNYPQVSRFLSIKQSFFSVGIDQDQFFRELDKIDKDVRQSLYTTRIQQEFDELYARLDTIERLLNISVTPEELQDFRTNRQKYATKVFINFVRAIRTQNTGTGESPNEMDYIDSDIYALDEYLKQVEDFYRLADERSLHFVDNLLRKMDQLDENLAVMVNGGFHTDKVLAELKNRNVTHISIKPRVSQQGVVNPYFELLQGRETPLEKLLAKNQNIMAVLTGFSQHAKCVMFSLPGKLKAKIMKNANRLPQEVLAGIQVYDDSNKLVTANKAKPESLPKVPQLVKGDIWRVKMQTKAGEYVSRLLIRVDNSRFTSRFRKALSTNTILNMTIGQEDFILLSSIDAKKLADVVEMINKRQTSVWTGLNEQFSELLQRFKSLQEDIPITAGATLALRETYARFPNTPKRVVEIFIAPWFEFRLKWIINPVGFFLAHDDNRTAEGKIKWHVVIPRILTLTAMHSTLFYLALPGLATLGVYLTVLLVTVYFGINYLVIKTNFSEKMPGISKISDRIVKIYQKIGLRLDWLINPMLLLFSPDARTSEGKLDYWKLAQRIMPIAALYGLAGIYAPMIFQGLVAAALVFMGAHMAHNVLIRWAVLTVDSLKPLDLNQLIDGFYNGSYHPFRIWKSQAVTDLLVDFYRANFEHAGVDPDMGEKYVKKIWENKNSKTEDELRQFGLAILTQAKLLRRYEVTEKNILDMITLKPGEILLDVGANDLDRINYLAKKFPESKFIGVDIIPRHDKFDYPDRCKYYEVKSDATSFPIEDESIDITNNQFSWHHFPDLDAIKRALVIQHAILKNGGLLILWEESFDKNVEVEELAARNARVGIQMDSEFTQRFYNLTEDQRWEFIIANDWLINPKNPHMPWTGQYYPWEEGWKRLVESYGFRLIEEYNLGLRVNGRLRQGAHIIGMFEKVDTSQGNVFSAKSVPGIDKLSTPGQKAPDTGVLEQVSPLTLLDITNLPEFKKIKAIDPSRAQHILDAVKAEEALFNEPSDFEYFLRVLPEGEEKAQFREHLEALSRLKPQRFSHEWIALRWALRLHDIGYSEGDEGNHALKGARIAERIMEEYGVEPAIISLASVLIREHMAMIEFLGRGEIRYSTFTRRINHELLPWLKIHTVLDTAGWNPSALSKVLPIIMNFEQESKKADADLFAFRIGKFAKRYNGPNLTEAQTREIVIDVQTAFGERSEELKEILRRKTDFTGGIAFVLSALAQKDKTHKRFAKFLKFLALIASLHEGEVEIRGDLPTNLAKALSSGDQAVSTKALERIIQNLPSNLEEISIDQLHDFCTRSNWIEFLPAIKPTAPDVVIFHITKLLSSEIAKSLIPPAVQKVPGTGSSALQTMETDTKDSQTPPGGRIGWLQSLVEWFGIEYKGWVVIVAEAAAAMAAMAAVAAGYFLSGADVMAAVNGLINLLPAGLAAPLLDNPFLNAILAAFVLLHMLDVWLRIFNPFLEDDNPIKKWTQKYATRPINVAIALFIAAASALLYSALVSGLHLQLAMPLLIALGVGVFAGVHGVVNRSLTDRIVNFRNYIFNLLINSQKKMVLDLELLKKYIKDTLGAMALPSVRILVILGEPYYLMNIIMKREDLYKALDIDAKRMAADLVKTAKYLWEIAPRLLVAGIAFINYIYKDEFFTTFHLLTTAEKVAFVLPAYILGVFIKLFGNLLGQLTVPDLPGVKEETPDASQILGKNVLFGNEFLTLLSKYGNLFRNWIISDEPIVRSIKAELVENKEESIADVADENPPGAIKWMADKLGLDAVGTGRVETWVLNVMYVMFTSVLAQWFPDLNMSVYLFVPIGFLYGLMYLGHKFLGIVGIDEGKQTPEEIRAATKKAIITSLSFPVIVMVIGMIAASSGLVAPIWPAMAYIIAVIISREWHGEENKPLRKRKDDKDAANLAELEEQYLHEPNESPYKSLIGQEFSRYQADRPAAGIATEESKRRNILFGPNFNLRKNVIFAKSLFLSVTFRPKEEETDAPINAEFFEKKEEVVLSMPAWAWKMVLNDNAGIMPSLGRAIMRLWLRLALGSASQLRNLRLLMISLGINRKDALVESMVEMMTEDVKPLEISVIPKAGKDLTVAWNNFLKLCSPIIPLADVAALESQFNPETKQQVKKTSNRLKAFIKYLHLFFDPDNSVLNSAAKSQAGSLAKLLAQETGGEVSGKIKAMAEQALSAALTLPGFDLAYNNDEVKTISIAALPVMARALLEKVKQEEININPGLLAVLKKMAAKDIKCGEKIVMDKPEEVASLLQILKPQDTRTESTQSRYLGKNDFGKPVYAIASTREFTPFTFKDEDGETTYYLSVVGTVTAEEGQSRKAVIAEVNAGNIPIHRFGGRDLAKPADRTAGFNTWQKFRLIFGGARVHQSIARENASAYFNQIMAKLNRLMPVGAKALLIQVLENPDNTYLQRMLMAVFAAKDEKSAVRAQAKFARNLSALVTNYYKLFRENYTKDNLDLLEENMLNLMALTYLSELLDPIMVVEKNYAAPVNSELAPLIAMLEDKGIKQQDISIPFALLGFRGSLGALREMVRQHNYQPKNAQEFMRRAIKIFAGAA
ncbi:methyltransferase domain-containing protein [bacterium]|nr:methyltransferase domain-containing protein [bacterium]